MSGWWLQKHTSILHQHVGKVEAVVELELVKDAVDQRGLEIPHSGSSVLIRFITWSGSGVGSSGGVGISRASRYSWSASVSARECRGSRKLAGLVRLVSGFSSETSQQCLFQW